MSKDNFRKFLHEKLTKSDNQYQVNSLEGFAKLNEKYEMPAHLALLFRARRPIEPLRALHKPVYDNRPL
jgi:hypothetical protein